MHVNTVDPLITELFSKSSTANFRSIILLSGTNSIAKLPLLHYLWTKHTLDVCPSILWCYKNKFAPNKYGDRKKRRISQKKMDTEFLNSKIRYCYYKDTKKILGNTYGMCIMEDFEAITPNSLARIIESVQGGGLIIFLLETVNSLDNLHKISLDIYRNFKNQASKPVTNRFLDRFFLSLQDCSTFLSLDANLKIYREGISSKTFTRNYPLTNSSENSNALLVELIKSLSHMEPLSCLLSKTKTFDQARAFLSLSEAIAEKKQRSTVILTSDRGRGKSATLGLAAAAAIAFGYANIFITAPNPENLHSFFAFLFLGLKALGYRENQDFEIIQNTKFKCVDNISFMMTHRQIVKFIFPSEISKFKSSIELLIIDEAAAIPFSLLSDIYGPFVTFISSTISGYEGSGKMFTLKLLKKIKHYGIENDLKFYEGQTRSCREIHLIEPIRYSAKDPVERWINDLLCLNIDSASISTKGCPNIRNCRLFSVNRNILFSSHKIANYFLQKIMSLFSSSHYKNSPDDLQMMCDAPSHRIFVLIPPLILSIGLVPDILSVLHTSYEGQMNIKFVKKCITNGFKMNGDLLPWAISRQFMDPTFGELSGVRIIRIVTSPDCQKMGYGTKAISLFNRFIDTKYICKKKETQIYNHENFKMSPILTDTKNKSSPKIDYMGVSFRLTLSLLCFWKKNGFNVFIIRSIKYNLSTEENVIMLKQISNLNLNSRSWYHTYRLDFAKKFINLLGSEFKEIPSIIVHNILEKYNTLKKNTESNENLRKFFSSHDFDRICFYQKQSSVDANLILDLFPLIGKLYFWNYFPSNIFSSIETILIIGLGLQLKTTHIIAEDLKIKGENVIKIITKILTKVYNALN